MYNNYYKIKIIIMFLRVLLKKKNFLKYIYIITYCEISIYNYIIINIIHNYYKCVYINIIFIIHIIIMCVFFFCPF